MPDASKSGSDRSVHIGGDANGNVIQTGDRNVASVHYQHATLPPPESVNIQTELIALRAALSQLNAPDHRKIDNAFSDAEDELAQSDPDKDEIGKALERALGYAKKAEDFTESIATLKPHLTNATSWLGSNWHKLLAVVGIAT